MAIDWGGLGEDIWDASLPGMVTRWFGDEPKPGSTLPALPPRTVNGQRPTYTNMTSGRRCRRRRPRLLTPTDLSDLAALKTITGGGQALNFAVMKAVRR